MTQSSRNQTAQQASPLHAVQQPLSQDVHSQQRRKKSKEIIHSGHFMVSDFEAEARDEDDELAIPVPEDAENPAVLVGMSNVNQAGDLAGTAAACSFISSSRQKKSDITTPGKLVLEVMLYKLLYKFWQSLVLHV